MRIRELSVLFRVLASAKRLEILRLLLDTKGRSVGEVAAGVKLSLKATSKHLLLLAQIGLVDSKRVGFSVFYRIVDDPPRYLDQILKQVKLSK